MIVTIIVIIAVLIIYLIIFHYLKDWIHSKVVNTNSDKGMEDFYKKNPSAKQYVGEEHSWEPTFNLEHRGLKVFNIPFVPEDNEIFYIENNYDEEANLFIKENIDLIREVLATKGLTFVYLPSISISKEMAEAMVAYYSANPNINSITNEDFKHGLRNDFLLDYMVYPQNRSKITHGFCWYNTATSLFKFKKMWYVFDYISFDGAEARQHPREVLEEMLPELGTRKIWRKGPHSEGTIESDSLADDNFDEETKKILSEIQEKLNSVRLKGISEAIIAQYVKPCPKLSRITISNDFTITLNDYNNTEIIMEPVVKAVFILFLRHEEGIYFKDLSDYRTELEIIYRAVKAKHNDIDDKIKMGFTPQISNSVKSLTNPFSNSINEKCTRIKEAFILHFHDSIASNYYIQGMRASEKIIKISRDLVIWEE